MKIPMSRPDIGELEIAKVNEVLKTSALSRGPMLKTFEQRLAGYVGTKHAVAVSSGTAALHLAIMTAGVKAGDEVITTPFSFVATANCILYGGARPVFVDIDPETLNLDPDLIEERVTNRTAAILPVHVFGQPCEMDKILEIAEQYQLRVIEDACESLGAEFDDRKVGTFGDLGVYAFYPNKQITTGEGGMVVTDDPQHATLLRSLRNQGRDDQEDPNHARLGFSYRIDELSCALGVAQLERIEELLAKREQVAAWYAERLGGAEVIRIPQAVPRRKISWFVYVIRLVEDIDRDRIMTGLAAEGIPSRPYFAPLHLHAYVQEEFSYKPGDFPVTEAVARSTVALPFHGNLREEEVEYVCDALFKLVG